MVPQLPSFHWTVSQMWGNLRFLPRGPTPLPCLLETAAEIASQNPAGVCTLARGLARQLQARLLMRAATQPLHEVGPDGYFDYLFFNTSKVVSADGRHFWDLINKSAKTSEERRKLLLQRDVVLPWPWHRGRFTKALACVGEGKSAGPWQAEANHCVDLLLPFGIGIVKGGNHSIAAGVLDGEGAVPARAIEMSPAFDLVEFDGANFRLRNSKLSLIERARFVEAGLLFELGRFMHTHGIQYDAQPWTQDPRLLAFAAERSTLLLDVHIDGRDTGQSVRTGVVEKLLRAAGHTYGSQTWNDVMLDAKPWLDAEGRSLTFKLRGPRLLADELDHIL